MTFRFAVVLVALVALIHPSATHTAVKDPLSFQSGTFNRGRHIAQPVDWLTWCNDCVGVDYHTQTPWVANPTTCMWDTDDYFEYSSVGSTLSADTSAKVNECSFESTSGSDPNVSKLTVIHVANLKISAPVSNLSVSETFTWSGGSHTFIAAPVWNTQTKLYDYNQCMFINGVSNGTWTSVLGSNGGYAVPVTITTTISNPTSRSISKISGIVQYGWQQYGRAGCTAPSPFPGPLG